MRLATVSRFLFAVFLSSTLSLSAQNRSTSEPFFSTVFSHYSAMPSPVVLTKTDLHTLLQWASDQGYNVFDLIDETTIYLESVSLRIQIQGSDLRSASAFFRLGDHRVDTLLPLPKLVSLTFGKYSQTDPAVEVILSSEHTGFLELGDFFLEKKYGFRTVAARSLQNAFGMRVRNGILTWDVDRIDRVPDPTGGTSPNFIGIELRLFPRAKRWHIDPIRPY